MNQNYLNAKSIMFNPVTFTSAYNMSLGQLKVNFDYTL